MDFDKFCLIVIGVIFVIALLFGVGIPSILGNRSLVDTKFKYNKAIVNIGEETIEIEISKWKDYDGEQIQVWSKDGKVYLFSSFNSVLVGE